MKLSKKARKDLLIRPNLEAIQRDNSVIEKLHEAVCPNFQALIFTGKVQNCPEACWSNPDVTICFYITSDCNSMLATPVKPFGVQ